MNSRFEFVSAKATKIVGCMIVGEAGRLVVDDGLQCFARNVA